MITNNKHFEFFKKECEKWRVILGLQNWKVYYSHDLEADSGSFARIHTKISDYVATIQFAKNWSMVGSNDIYQGIRETAKHEMVHLLLARVSEYGKSRYYTATDFYEAEEETVRKLEYIIK